MNPEREAREEDVAPAAAPSGLAVVPERTLAATVTSLQRRAGNRAVLGLQRRGLLPGGRRPTRRLARRRLPSTADLRQILFDPNGSGGFVDAPDAAAHRAGLERLLVLSQQEMTAAQRAHALTDRQGALTAAQWSALSPSEQSVRTAGAVVGARSDTLLGDPLLINTGPRPGTSDAANIATLVNAARAVFDQIASGALDTSIEQIFGVGNIATAKAKYANARARMIALHGSGQIVTDRSGYNREVGLGGLTNWARISVSPDTIDNPTNKESVVTLVHESMHAGNPRTAGPPIDVGVTDLGYIYRPEFPRASADTKLHNAAHFEVVARRYLVTTNYTFAGQTFIPAGTSVGGASSAALTPKEEAIRQASEMYRQAWTIGLNLHNLFVRVYRTPTEWSTLDLATAFGGVAGGVHWADTLPFWSKVEGLTIHNRASINPASADPSIRPVTLIDVALSESVVRRLSRGMGAVPGTEAQANALEATATAPERAAASTIAAERDLLIRLVARDIDSITGTPARDLQVVLRMGSTANLWADILAARAPAAFPY